MSMLSILCFTGALVLAAAAVVYQCGDIIPGYGNTMGGEMMANSLWILVSLLCAAGSLAFIPWYFSALILITVYAVSFPVKLLIERTLTTAP